MSITSYIGEQLKTCRKKAGFTQVELSEITGLDRSYIANVEAGKRNITVVNLEKMLSPLNTDFSTFFSMYKSKEELK